MKVLVVEDDLPNRDLLVRRIERRGFETISAADGATALQLCQTASPDLILLDLGLPNLSGLDIVRLLRAADGRTPVIVITADDSKRGECLAAGCDAFMVKPVDFSALFGQMSSLGIPVDGHRPSATH